MSGATSAPDQVPLPEFTFLADQIVNRVLGGSVFPTAWFQSVSALAVIVLAPFIQRLMHGVK